ncbi:stage V sporulation protein D [Barrientosiimonas marina]|uniref:serine-type D-Ala-D-Ala carboxypeptidase n=1 Tax=Lentibacillus kimchii TaxID=1542911 RepID=A0ABW2USV8_9BACI
MKRVSSVTVRKRMIFVFLAGLLMFTIISVRLGYVQFVLGDDLMELADESWSRDITFEPERGNILDRHGDVLAENVTAPSVIVVPKQIKHPQNTAEEMADILGISEQDAYDYVTKDAVYTRVHPDGRKISDEQEEAFRTLNLDGIYLAKDSKRHYPYDDYLSHVLGFAGIDNQGLMGLEQYYNDKLDGESGSLSFYSDAKGQKLDQIADDYQAPEDGMDLKTTIDSSVQTIMERELDLAVSEYDPDGALAIAVDPDNGGVLGMATRPNFDPENYQNTDPEIYDRNLPIWKTYEPGSTFKIITLASALEENVVDLDEDEFYDDGAISVDGTQLHCWKSGGHGRQSYLEVVQNSCNPGFVQMGLDLGKERLFSYIDDFGFGKKTGVDLRGEGNGILFDPDNIGQIELATTSFGQGVSVTPIQQVMAVSAAVNGGKLYEPHIAEKWLDPQTEEVVEEEEPVLKENIISKDTSKEVRKTLETVVAEGTGRSAYVDDYRVGGKTGTAQKVGPDGNYLANNYIVSFMGFAPADDPEIVVYVAVDNPKDTSQFGGVVSAPIVGNIIGDSLREMDVEPRDEGPEKEYTWPDEPKVEVPDLIGIDKHELMEYQTNLSIETSGSGDYIVDQEPNPGTKVEKGEKIRIYLSDKNAS